MKKKIIKYIFFFPIILIIISLPINISSQSHTKLYYNDEFSNVYCNTLTIANTENIDFFSFIIFNSNNRRKVYYSNELDLITYLKLKANLHMNTIDQNEIKNLLNNKKVFIKLETDIEVISFIFNSNEESIGLINESLLPLIVRLGEVKR
jgi:hypothetical protein